MRRRSTRSSTKVSPEKPIDSPSNKPRLRSRRRRSSSRSSSEEPTRKRVLRNSANKSDRKSPENEKKEDNNENIESPVSRKQENRKRTSNNHESVDDVKELKAREISTKPDHSEEVSVKTEEKESIEGKELKGKSKGKNKSKSDNSPQISESESHMQSEISENAQVTSQSPTHTSVNIPSDNVLVSPDEINNSNIENMSKESDVENMSKIVKTETVTESVEIVKSEEDTKECLQAHGEFKSENYEIDKEEKTPQSTMELQCSTDTENTSIKEDTENTSIKEDTENTSIKEDTENTVIKEDTENTSMKEEHGEQAETNQNAINTVATDLKQVKEVEEETLEMETEKLSPTSHNTSVTEEKEVVVEEIRKDGVLEEPEPQNISQLDTSLEKDTTFNITDSCNEDVQKLVEANEEIQNLKSQVLEIFRTPEPKIRRRKWGNSVVSLHLMNTSLSKIDVNTIKNLCPNVEFLEENEVKLEIKERRKSAPESKDKKMERKVSLDYKSDGDYSQFQRQTSASSTEDKNESDNSHIIAMNRKISIVDDTASKLRPPPSPAKNPVSAVLFITNLVRPFTLKQLKDLLERTGKIKQNGFWTDKVKSKCYVHYETEEEAEATRNALHGVNWPVGNAKQLCIEYATEEDLENARNPPPIAAPPVESTNIIEKENKIPEKQTRDDKPKEREKARNNVREWDLEKQNKKRSFSREREERDKRRHRRSATPIDYIKRKQLKEEEEIPQKRMDDLFRKTKASPSIYWLPLTPEEIAIKEQQRLQRMAEHKRRMEESSRSGRVDYGRGAAYRRRY
ncbi:apoptotic chromatin condensation inducer in the nucleus [Agrilus planipennis]|uniref:Apoptotic chromatin condensation inducer in the nucleus n=1 Tax=Agrilus planipennis TaxID=224129 RepID=A0A1W4WJU4_AGRPL|nr:apoptotic chromatin condensation inducer in the nucleus [Agrilus planipennis]